MLQKICKTLGFKKIMEDQIPPLGEVNHIWQVVLESIYSFLDSIYDLCYCLDFSTLDYHVSFFDVLLFET